MQTHPTLSSAILGGIAGTAIMSAMMYMVAPMMGIHMDIAAMLGSMMGGSWTAARERAGMGCRAGLDRGRAQGVGGSSLSDSVMLETQDDPWHLNTR